MPTKDYVKKQPRKRTSHKRGAAKKAKSSALPKLRIGLVLLVLIALVSGLVWLAQQPNSTDNPVNNEAPKEARDTVSTPEIDDEPLPQLPEEEWEFIKSLPGYEVEVNVSAIESDKLYLMQCGSFKVFEQADALRAQMAMVGLEPQIRGTNSGWYRVILGPYESKRAAERDRHTLSQNRVRGCKIWFWNL